MAKRLIVLGFADAARNYLRSAADGADQRERRLLRAKAALALRQPLDAEAELLGIVGDDADLLRVQARELAGDFNAALDGMNAATSAEQRRNLAWLAGDWSTLVEAGEDVLSQAAQLALSGEGGSSDNSDDTQESGPLATARALIAGSQGSRAVLRDLLEEMTVDVAPDP